MAIIYTYPKKSEVEANDTFIITDSDDNSTKVVTAQSLANYIDGTITLQEVLDTGNAAYYNAAGVPATVGNLILGNTSGVGVKSTTIELDGQTGNVQLLDGVNGSTGNLTVGGNIAGGDQLTLTDNLDVLTLLADDNTLTNQSSVSSSQGLTLKNANNGMSLIAAGQLNSTSTSSMSFIATGNVDISSGAANAVRIGDPSGTLANSVQIGAQNVVSIESDNNNVNILANNGAVNIGNSGGDETNSILMSTDGNITLDFNVAGGHVTSNGSYQTANGLPGTPAYSFNNDPDTGFYLEAVDKSAIAIGGANVLQVWRDGVKLSQPLLLQNAASIGTNSYEEFTAFEYGTFTPVLTGNNVGADLDASYDVQVGKYLRINNIIYGWFDIRLTSINDNLNYTQPSGLIIQARAINGTGIGLFGAYPPAVPAAAVATQVSGGEVNISFKSGFNVLDRFFLPTSGYISSASDKEIVLQVFNNEVTNVGGIDRLNLSMTAATAINTFPAAPAQGAASNARIAGTFSYIFETP